MLFQPNLPHLMYHGPIQPAAIYRRARLDTMFIPLALSCVYQCAYSSKPQEQDSLRGVTKTLDIIYRACAYARPVYEQEARCRNEPQFREV
jgi:hypothetical protein